MNPSSLFQFCFFERQNHSCIVPHTNLGRLPLQRPQQTLALLPQSNLNCSNCAFSSSLTLLSQRETVRSSVGERLRQTALLPFSITSSVHQKTPTNSGTVVNGGTAEDRPKAAAPCVWRPNGCNSQSVETSLPASPLVFCCTNRAHEDPLRNTDYVKRTPETSIHRHSEGL